MGLTLILMRHAKSSWDNPGPDHARPLNARGRRSATNLGHWLRAQGLVPDEALVSDAARTRETFERLRLEVTPRFLRDLYHAEAHEMMQVLAQAGGRCVLMVGHNPGIAELAEALAETPPDDGGFQRYPTGATTAYRFDAEGWGRIVPGEGVVTHFVVPRSLERAAG